MMHYECQLFDDKELQKLTDLLKYMESFWLYNLLRLVQMKNKFVKDLKKKHLKYVNMDKNFVTQYIYI